MIKARGDRAERIASAAAKLKQAQALEKEAKEQLKKELAEGETVIAKNWKVSRSKQIRNEFKKAKMIELFGEEAYNNCKEQRIQYNTYVNEVK